jgi:serine/threonine protein phosphatase 1
MLSFFRRKSVPQLDLPPPVPDGLTYAVGDIHGRLDLLELAIAAIEADRKGTAATVVFLGDYIDRGPESAGVLNRLFCLRGSGLEVVCLMGNHERMMLDFLDDPDGCGERWLDHGGSDTLTSFAVSRPVPSENGTLLQGMSDLLREALGSELEQWLRDLALSWRSGSLGCVHAFTDPARDWQSQTERVLLWGRPPSELSPRPDGMWVAHGHTIVPEAVARSGHIALDTGAYKTGVLSILKSSDEGLRFFCIQRGGSAEA